MWKETRLEGFVTIVDLRKAGEPTAVAMIIKTQGFALRTIGAKMVI